MHLLSQQQAAPAVAEDVDEGVVAVREPEPQGSGKEVAPYTRGDIGQDVQERRQTSHKLPLDSSSAIPEPADVSSVSERSDRQLVSSLPVACETSGLHTSEEEQQEQDADWIQHGDQDLIRELGLESGECGVFDRYTKQG
jgi:hypothetical protein